MNIWQSCTHQFTQRQIQQQKKDDISKKNSIWVHFIRNFAWSHYMINIHECIMIDILHQLLKDTVIYMLDWLDELIEKRIVAFRKKKEYQLHINHAFNVAQLNKRFRNVSAFVELKSLQSIASSNSERLWIERSWFIRYSQSLHHCLLMNHLQRCIVLEQW